MISEMKKFIKYFLYNRLSQKEEKNLLLMAGLYLQQIKKTGPVESLGEVEMRVFSQWGEDGIIQYIIHNIQIPNKVFVEFGVETYEESNTRFLLVNNNWSGLVIDGSDENIGFIQKDPVYMRHDLKAVSSFITRDNINTLIKEHVAHEDIGVLSIDIDGNDYWVWEAIDVVKPRIVICEYNSVFGSLHKITTPYKSDFVRHIAHHSYLYFGASLGAMCDLAERKGYDFVGTNSTGVNAFFVRKDLSQPFKKYRFPEGYVASKHTESRNAAGEFSFLRGEKRLEEIKDMPVYSLDLGKEVRIRELYK